MTAMMGVPVQHILFTVFQSIFQVFLLCLAGFTLSFKGIVDKPTSKVLNHINIALFTPALLFSKVAYFLSPAKLRQLWVIPIFFVVLTGLSALIAHWLARACRLKRSQVNFATAASMFMNSNSLPVALMQSLATTVPLLKWGSDDTVDAMFGRSLTYLVVFSTLGMILRWSYGLRLLSKADEPEPIAAPPTTFRDADDTDQHHMALDPSPATLVDYETEPDIDPRGRHVWLTHRHPHPLSRSYIHGHSHLPAIPTSLGDQSESEDSEDELDTTEGDSEDTIALRSEVIDTGFSTEVEDHAPPQPEPTLTPRWDRPPPPSLFKRVFNTLTSLSPPLVGSLFALFCVLVPPVQQALKSEEMIPFKGALDSAGACSVPLTLLVLGGWFWDGDSTPNNKHEESKPGSDGQGNAKSQGTGQGIAKNKGKGKGVEKRHVPISMGPYTRLILDSRDSSSTSLSSMIGAFGDVLMGRMHTRRDRVRGRRRTSNADRGLGTAQGDVDVESGSGPHTETRTEIEHAVNGRGSRSPSAINGHALLSPISSSPSPTPILPAHTHTSMPSGRNLPGETLTVIITLLARMVIVPLVVTPIMVLVCRLGWGGEVFEDPVFIVSSMLLIASPPALTLAQISQRAKTATPDAPGGLQTTDPNTFSPFERLLSRTVFWAYLVLTPPMTIASVMVGLLLIEA